MRELGERERLLQAGKNTMNFKGEVDPHQDVNQLIFLG